MNQSHDLALTPLAKEIYRQLVRRVRGRHGSITYGELAAEVSHKIPIHPRSPRLHDALGEVTLACRTRDLPVLPAIVWRTDSRRPSDGYYKLAHPRARSYKSQLAAWAREHARVLRDRQRFPGAL
ncbi:MAG: hypothetical protein H6Q90_5219 [Deltaproteobacteria bacterium]|nr:hypothetical protein [Deltaproteobacteria bacterium]